METWDNSYCTTVRMPTKCFTSKNYAMSCRQKPVRQRQILRVAMAKTLGRTDGSRVKGARKSRKSCLIWRSKQHPVVGTRNEPNKIKSMILAYNDNESVYIQVLVFAFNIISSSAQRYDATTVKFNFTSDPTSLYSSFDSCIHFLNMLLSALLA